MQHITVPTSGNDILNLILAPVDSKFVSNAQVSLHIHDSDHSSLICALSYNFHKNKSISYVPVRIFSKFKVNLAGDMLSRVD